MTPGSIAMAVHVLLNANAQTLFCSQGAEIFFSNELNNCVKNQNADQS